jgi:hypothetical protein
MSPEAQCDSSVFLDDLEEGLYHKLKINVVKMFVGNANLRPRGWFPIVPRLKEVSNVDGVHKNFDHNLDVSTYLKSVFLPSFSPSPLARSVPEKLW